MRTPRSARNPKRTTHGPTRRTRTWLGILLGAAAAVSMLIVGLGSATPLAASTSSPAEQAAKEKRYKGTRAYVVDKQTGQIRMPTQQEVDELVATLSSLGQRPPETLKQSSQAGAVLTDLDGGFAGILLGRPNGDGTWETKCVFTLEEGAEFLGIVVDDASR